MSPTAGRYFPEGTTVCYRLRGSNFHGYDDFVEGIIGAFHDVSGEKIGG